MCVESVTIRMTDGPRKKVCILPRKLLISNSPDWSGNSMCVKTVTVGMLGGPAKMGISPHQLLISNPPRLVWGYNVC